MARGSVDWPRRLLTVCVGIPTALKLLQYDIGMWCLATGLCLLALLEFATSITRRIVTPRSAVTCAGTTAHLALLLTLSGAVCTTAASYEKIMHDAVMTVSVFTLCCFHLALIERVDLHALMAMLLDVFAFLYVVSGFSHAILLRNATPFGFAFQVLGLSCAWVCDSGALVAGSLFGSVKLAPSISPGKTLVGAIAGILSSAGTVVLFYKVPLWMGLAQQFLPAISLSEQIVLGLVLGFLCIAGDLVESLLKRVADVKDSGTFFPGHGGCLDRMDSFLFVAQALYYYSAFRFAV
ncbi:hypothetical protein Poli38472_002876 [Pythium oligandrum]|uniref:Phosphatidate cytidylyltransferase n=1 Tax=Pythium oligandrum TaxID=41045 RepID=A0A8K1C5S2_PYTOL|nr:hypothetical protein Poli38472_002876 [Pythium oligandrum]|eukprot:TMW56951.1 hypothetical protein Poli38472_002876 [Pythium oligandrum]